jgi:hypothetical protein
MDPTLRLSFMQAGVTKDRILILSNNASCI